MSATTNFQQFNPTGAFMEDDAAYTLDTLRANGIPTAAIFPHLTGNKAFYQWSIWVAAFAEMMRQKGVSTSDANFANLVSALSSVRLAGDFLTAIIEVPFATSVVFDASTSAQYDLILTGNVVASTLINTSPGQILVFIIVQDAVGGRSLAWPANLNGAGAICQVASSISVQMFDVRPNGYIFPLTRMMWFTASGLSFSNGPTVVSINSTGTVAAGFDELTEKCDASGGAITRTLYTAVGNMGRKVNGQKVDTSRNNANYQGTGGQTIDGLSIINVSRQNMSLTFQSDGANWVII